MHASRFSRKLAFCLFATSLLTVAACDDEEGDDGDTMNASAGSDSSGGETGDSADSADSADSGDSGDSGEGCEGETGEDMCPDYTSCVTTNCDDCLDTCSEYIDCASSCPCDDLACQTECLMNQSSECMTCFTTQGMCAAEMCATELNECAMG